MNNSFSRTVLTTVLMMLSASMYAGEPVKYLDENGKEKSVTEYVVLSNEWLNSFHKKCLKEDKDFVLSTGWYVVNGELELEQEIPIEGTLHVILSDGATLRGAKQIDEMFCGDDRRCNPDTLCVYAQSVGDDMGTIENLDRKYYFTTSASLVINGGRMIWKPTACYSDDKKCFNLDKFVVNCGYIEIQTNVNGIVCEDLELNGGYINIIVSDDKIGLAASRTVKIGHSTMDLMCDCGNFLYYGEEDILVDDYVSVQMDGHTYSGFVPFDITDIRSISHIETHYDAVAASVFSRNVCETKAYAVWYGLDGVRMPTVPAEKGIYIHNGKKILVK